MKRFLVQSLAVALVSFMAIGCGGGGGSTTPTTPSASALTQTDVSKLKLVDVAGKPLVGATVEIGSSTTASTKMSKTTYTVGADGTITIDALEAGKYEITITIGGVTTTATLQINDTNLQEMASVMAGVEILTDGSINLIEGAIIASISGSVTDTANVPIEDAQVAVSGGTTTNGAFASAITDENGGYILFINVNSKLVENLTSLSITASANGYTSKSLSAIEVLQSISQSGLNFQLATGSTTATYSETFDGDVSGWTKNKISGTNANNMWHQHTPSVTGVNKAFTDGLVSLAPNDTSNGNIPAPKSGNCMWYGNGVASDGTFGNFIDTLASWGNEELSGGTSDSYNSGELISPPINLASASGALNLTFDSYWEIESVNPNKNGFDVMTISISTDNGSTWKILARLNPLSDPFSSLNREPIPFSNTGFNSAPTWLTQEGINLVDASGNSVAGQTIKLKFTFDTKDGLYNGFRGWMVDNVKINTGEGTFPPYEDNFDSHYDQKPSRR